jgi:hypothetical protein
MIAFLTRLAAVVVLALPASPPFLRLWYCPSLRRK